MHRRHLCIYSMQIIMREFTFYVYCPTFCANCKMFVSGTRQGLNTTTKNKKLRPYANWHICTWCVCVLRSMRLRPPAALSNLLLYTHIFARVFVCCFIRAYALCVRAVKQIKCGLAMCTTHTHTHTKSSSAKCIIYIRGSSEFRGTARNKVELCLCRRRCTTHTVLPDSLCKVHLICRHLSDFAVGSKRLSRNATMCI